VAAGVIRVMLADDQRVVREGLGTLLGLLDVATAADARRRWRWRRPTIPTWC
jgi:DNA-binding NarL/FixJ family response regulator